MTTMPDFKERAKNIVDREELEAALEQAFNEGKEVGWVEEWERASVIDVNNQLEKEENA